MILIGEAPDKFLRNRVDVSLSETIPNFVNWKMVFHILQSLAFNAIIVGATKPHIDI